VAILTGSEIYTVYGFRDPMWKKNKRGIFYVGVTKGKPHDRFLDHASDARNGHMSLKLEHIRQMWAKGREVEIVTLREGITDREEAFKEESRFIAEIGMDNLLNMSQDRTESGLYARQVLLKKGTRDDTHKYDKKQPMKTRKPNEREGDFVRKR
jgi:hypothetical protein